MEVLKGVKEGRCAQGKVREEMKGLVARLVKLEVLMGDMAARTSKEKVEIDQRVTRLEREDRNETEAYSRMERTLEEMRAGLQDCQLSRRNNLVFHGLTTKVQGEETQTTLVEHVRHILQSKLGIGRAVQITRVARLGQSQPVLGCQPVLVTFLHHSHKDEVFRKAALLPRLAGILITEDLPKASLPVSPREKLPVCQCSAAGHLSKKGKMEKMGEFKHEFELGSEVKSEDSPEKLADQDCEGSEDDINVQQESFLDAAEGERDFVERVEVENDNHKDKRVEYVSGEVDGAECNEVVFDTGNVNMSEVADSNQRNATHGASESDNADERESLRKETIKLDRKDSCDHKAAMKSNVSDQELNEEESSEEEKVDEKEANGVDKSGVSKEQEEVIFDFFD